MPSATDNKVVPGPLTLPAPGYLHSVEGRDAERASALPDLAAHGDAARLPKSILNRHGYAR
jgi:hypothetical protein